MAWWVMLLGGILSAADRDGVRGTKLARGWVTAQLIYEGMPNSLSEMLTTGMRGDMWVVSTWGGTTCYHDYGLRVTTDLARGKARWASFAPLTLQDEMRGLLFRRGVKVQWSE
jgi:hypothetical protein